MTNDQVASILYQAKQIKAILIAPTWKQLEVAEANCKAQLQAQWTMAMHFERYDQLDALKNRLWICLIEQNLDVDLLTFEQWKLMMLGAINLVYPILIIDQSEFQEWTILTIDSIDHIFSAIKFVCQSKRFVVIYNHYYHEQLQMHFLFLKQFFANHFQIQDQQEDLFSKQKRLLAKLKMQLLESKNEVQLLLEQHAKWD